MFDSSITDVCSHMLAIRVSEGVINDNTCNHIICDINRGPSHVKQPVDTKNDYNTSWWYTNAA